MATFDETTAALKLKAPVKPRPRNESTLDLSPEAVNERKRKKAEARRAGNGADDDPPSRSLRIYDAFNLMEMNMQDPTFVCRLWISEGVTLLVGRPKLGKTTLMRQLVLAANTGDRLLTSTCERCEVLFLSLEEGERLMRKKLLDMGAPPKSLQGVTIAFEWPQAAEGVEKLREWLTARKIDRQPLIVIDALVRFRLPPSDRGNAYVEDYNAVRMLSELCKDFPGLSIVVLHHVKKAIVDDPVSMISGTYGLTAAIDNYLIMLKVGEQYHLHAGGRLWMGDIADFEMRREGGGWVLAGEWDPTTSDLTPKQRAVIDQLKTGAKTPTAIAAATGQQRPNVSAMLASLHTRGIVEPIANGWALAKKT